MKKLLFAMLFPVLMAGCGSINQNFVTAVNDSWTEIAPEYRAYVESDSSKSKDDKRIRYFLIDTLTDLIEEAKTNE